MASSFAGHPYCFLKTCQREIPLATFDLPLSTQLMESPNRRAISRGLGQLLCTEQALFAQAALPEMAPSIQKLGITGTITTPGPITTHRVENSPYCFNFDPITTLA